MLTQREQRLWLRAHRAIRGRREVLKGHRREAAKLVAVGVPWVAVHKKSHVRIAHPLGADIGNPGAQSARIRRAARTMPAARS